MLLTRWFDDGRGKAMGVAYLGIGVGGALVPILAHALTTAFGWRGALRWLGLLMIAVAFPPAFFVRDRPAPERARELPAADSLRPVLTRPAFWLLAIGSMTSIGAVGGTTQNLKLYLSLDRHLGQADIAGILSLLLVGSLVGRITMGWLADRWEKKHVMVLVYAIVALSIPPLAMSSMPAMLRVFAFLFGVGLGGDSSDGRRTVRRPRHGTPARRHHHRRRHRRSGRADGRRGAPRFHRQLRIGVLRARGARGRGRGCRLHASIGA